MLRRAAALLTTTAAMLAGLAVTPASAHTYSIISGHTVTVRSGPATTYGSKGSVTGGQRVAIACTVRGQSVTGPYGTTDVWDYIHLEGYISDAFVYTGVSGPVGPPCGSDQLHWDPSEMRLGVDQPGTRRLYNEMKAKPAWNLRGGDAHFAGIYVNKPGEHGEGRALDYWMDIDRPAEFQAGWNIANFMKDNARSYGVQTVIWNDKVWLASNPNAGWQEYDEIGNCGDSSKRCKHNDHVHISQNWAGAVLKTTHWM
ncbi:hypothetical protein LWC34_15870 [Kibdelosporangium philippinense]|uniref:ARB-07466-like C-terminal domain-containing protein n=1 Tax=Kibdelosporangium philippinense TaxID=211113 RepID=A0ABS8ZEN6_9PSEU|nr:hypothetical protein [Kibdelosporangium philippinense]MCE7004302.1 hypothetical protein [Kibdelosporangium philippinense]